MLHAIYGGAFDPVHDGHLAVARAARDVLDADIAMVPTGDPPHRRPAHAEATHRVAMLERAIAHEPRLSIDRRELDRVGPSYTIATLAQLRAEHGPHAPLAMIVGNDAFAGLPDWHRWTELLDLAHVVVATRPDAEAVSPILAAYIADRLRTTAAALHESPGGCVYRLKLAPHPQSSSAIRARCASGLSLQGWVPEAVAGYIAAHGLYRAD